MKRVLVIEDSQDFLDIFKQFLSTDFEVVVSLDQDEIERLIPEVDLVICDYHFSPVLTFEKVVEIVADRKPVILCSGSPDVTYRHSVPKTEAYKSLKPLALSLLNQGVKLQITSQGGIQMLHDDQVDLSEFGSVKVFRASHVEWEPEGWYVDSAKTGRRLASGFKTRQEALTWEKSHYSPGGDGWDEIEDSNQEGEVG